MGMLEVSNPPAEYTCPDCQRTLARDKYYWHKRGNRHSKSCRDCYQIKRRPYQIAYMQKVGKAKARARYTPEQRSISIIKSYGLTLEKYNAMLEAQNGGCAICGSKTAKTKRNGRFCVDHDHQTGEVRGLLCAPCNRGIGLLQDSVTIMEAATKYLSRRAWSC